MIKVDKIYNSCNKIILFLCFLVIVDYNFIIKSVVKNRVQQQKKSLGTVSFKKNINFREIILGTRKAIDAKTNNNCVMW